MAVFGRVSAGLGPRDLIDDELFRWQTCWRIGPENLAGTRFVRALEMAGDMTIVDQSSGAVSPLCPYTIYRVLQNSLMHLCPFDRQSWSRASMRMELNEYFQNIILEILAHSNQRQSKAKVSFTLDGKLCRVRPSHTIDLLNSELGVRWNVVNASDPDAIFVTIKMPPGSPVGSDHSAGCGSTVFCPALSTERPGENFPIF